MVIASTLIPRGALSFNPKLIEGHNSLEDDEKAMGEEAKEPRKDDKLEASASRDYPVYVNGAAVPEMTK